MRVVLYHYLAVSVDEKVKISYPFGIIKPHTFNIHMWHSHREILCISYVYQVLFFTNCQLRKINHALTTFTSFRFRYALLHSYLLLPWGNFHESNKWGWGCSRLCQHLVIKCETVAVMTQLTHLDFVCIVFTGYWPQRHRLHWQKNHRKAYVRRELKDHLLPTPYQG